MNGSWEQQNIEGNPKETEMQRTIRHLRNLVGRLERYGTMMASDDQDLAGISMGLMVESQQLAKLSEALAGRGS